MRVDTDLVKKLAKMLDENDLSEIEVEDSGRRIVVKRKLGAARRRPAPRRPHPQRRRAAAPAAAPAAEISPADHPGAVKSPMVGTVYPVRRARRGAVRGGRRARSRRATRC